MKYRIEQVTRLLRGVSRKGFFHLLSADILLRLLGFGSQLLLIKCLAPEQLGQIKTMQSFNEMAMIFALFGLSASVQKACSEDRPMGARAKIFWQHFGYSFAPTGIVLVVLYCLAHVSLLSPDPAVNELQVYFMWAIPATVLLTLLSSYFLAIKQAIRLASIQVAVRVFGVLLIVGLTCRFGIHGFIAGTVSISFVGLIVSLVFFRRVQRALCCGGVPQKRSSDDEGGIPRSEVLSMSGWSFLSNFTHRLSANLDIFFLNYLVVDRIGFGYYSIATILLIPMSQITTSVRAISLPYIAEKLASRRELDRVIKKYRTLMLLQSIAVTLLAWLAVPLMVNFFYGEQYVDVVSYFVMISFGYIFHSYQALLPTTLVAMGKTKYTFFAALTYLPISALISYFAIDIFGIPGGAVSRSMTALVMTIVIIIFCTRAIDEYYKERAQNLVV